MNNAPSRLSGVFANLPTALQDQSADFDDARMRDHVEWLSEEGVHGFGCLLSSGEFTYLSRTERKAVIDSVVAAVGGRVAVLAGVSAETTAATIDLARDAADAGVDAVLVQPRSYVPLATSEVIRHYTEVASSINVPIGIYNNPPTTGFNITPEIYDEVVDATGAIVTKDGSGDLFNVPQVVGRSDHTMAYLWGTEYLTLPALAAGAHGVCVAIASVFPRQILDIHQAVVEEDLKAGQRAYEGMVPIFRAFKQIGTPRAVKASARIIGRSLGPHRAPLRDLADDQLDLLRKAIAETGAFVS